MKTAIAPHPLDGLLTDDAVARIRQQLEVVSRHPDAARAVALNYAEVAWLLKVNPRTIRRYVASGDLAAVNLAGRQTPRVMLPELIRFLERSPGVRADVE